MIDLEKRKLRQQEFISKATEKFKGKYNYDKVIYKKANIPVIITCPIHGDFQQTPTQHLRLTGCPRCAKKKSIKSPQKIQEAKEIFLTKAKAIWGDKFDYSKVDYESSGIKVCIICSKHGEFWQTPGHHIAGEQCPKCSQEEAVEKRKVLSEVQFLKTAHNKFPQYDYTRVEYINAKTPVEIVCPLHGAFWVTPDNFIRTCTIGCQKCAKNHRHSTEEWIVKATLIHKNKYNYSKVVYTNAHDKVCIICPKHGEFFQEANSHLMGSGCPKCQMRTSQLKLYNRLKQDLQIDLEFDYKTEWLGKQSFDIYSKEYNFAVEYNGLQHYEPIDFFGGKTKLLNMQRLDSEKLQKCVKNNCLLFTLKYDYSDIMYNDLINSIKNIIHAKEEINREYERRYGKEKKES